MAAARSITAHVAADGMTAWVEVLPGAPAGADELAEAMKRAGLVFGVDQEVSAALAAALEDETFAVSDLCIATGLPARPGTDGYFSPAFAPGLQPGHIGEHNSMDFRDRGLLKPVRPGDRVGALHAPVAGQSGQRVDGGELPVAAVRPARLTLGPGVTLQTDGELVARIAGVILYLPQQSLDVVQHHSHHGDVDLKSGHLDMEGSLAVSGDVQRLFHVVATGDVDIAGMVAGGSVRAGGSIHVRGSVHGGEQGSMYGHGDITLHSADHAQIHSQGSLLLESAVNCLLEAEVIQVGVLRGGEARAERFVTVREAGSAGGADTIIAVAVPLVPAREEVRQAVASAKLRRSLQRGRGGDETGRAVGRQGKVERALGAPLRADLGRVAALRARQGELLQTAHVVVAGLAHAGVTVRVGTAQLALLEPREATRFFYDASGRAVGCERYVP